MNLRKTLRVGLSTLLDVALWLVMVIYALGGLRIGGRLKFTYLNDYWIAIGCLYILGHLALGLEMRATRFGRAFASMAESSIHSIKARSLEPLKGMSLPSWALLLLSVYISGIYLFLPVFNFWSFGNTVFDLGVIENAVYNGSVTGKFFTYFLMDPSSNPIEYFPHNRLNFGLWIFAAIYKVAQRPDLLLFLQSFAMFSAAIPLYKLADRILPREIPRWAPLLLYFFWDPIHRMNVWDIHEAPFFIPFTLWAFYFIESGKVGWAILHMVLMAMWREDAWWTFCGMAIYAAIRTRRWKIWAPVALVGFLLFPMFTAFFNQVNSVGERYPYLGPNISSAIQVAIHKPWIFFQVAWENSKFFLRLILSSGGAAFLFGGWSMIPSIPPILELGLAQHGGMTNWLNHYVGNFTGPVMFATLYGWTWIYRKFGPKWIGVSLAIALTQLSFNETGALRMAMDKYRDHRCMQKLVEMIPTDVALIAGDPIASHLTHRRWISLPNPDRDQTEATWFVDANRKYLDLPAKGKYSVGPWQIVSEGCRDLVVAKRERLN